MLACIRCTTMPVYDESKSLLCIDCQRKADGLDDNYNREQNNRILRHNKLMAKYRR